MNLIAGCVIEFSDKANQPGFAAVMSQASGSVRVFLPNGKETKIPLKKVLHATSAPVVNVSDHEACKAALARINEDRQKRYAQINLQELHELLLEENRSFTLQEIAGFLFAEEDGEDAVAALLRSLTSDRLYFRNKNEMYTPVSDAELVQLKAQLDKQQELQEQQNRWVEDLRLANSQKELSPELLARVNDLKLFIIYGSEAPIEKKFLTALGLAGMANQRKMMALLVACGIMEVDENLLLTKYRVPLEFSREALDASDTLTQQARQQIDDFKEDSPAKQIELSSEELKATTGRLNLCRLPTWAIDTPGSKDRDDAFSWEELSEGKIRLYVHIADPAQFILPDSVLDDEAARRGSSIYMPEQSIHMLPGNVSEDCLSLDEGSPCFALTFILEFSATYELLTTNIRETLVKIERATDYESADALLENDLWLKRAYDLAAGLKKQRAENGAAMFPRQPELYVKVVDGQICVGHRSRDDKTAGMVAEFMIWANHAAAEFCRQNSVPCLYRSQEGPEEKCEFAQTFEPESFFKALKSFRKTVVSANPARHSSLGLNSYTQVTSPLRRYADLLLHRLIKAKINNRDLPYNQNELQQRILLADEALSRADEIMREREKYFLFKYLKLQQKEGAVVFDGQVVEVGNNDVTCYVEFLCSFKHCRKPSFSVAVGQKVKIRVKSIDLFDGILRLELLEQ